LNLQPASEYVRAPGVQLLKIAQLTTKFDDGPDRPCHRRVQGLSYVCLVLRLGGDHGTARPQSREIANASEAPGVRRLARQLITEFGEQAPAMARPKAQESSSKDEAQTWLRVLDAVKSLSPGREP